MQLTISGGDPMKKILVLLALLVSAQAYAADNIAVTVGSGTTIKTKDVGGGVEESQVLLSDASGASILGTAGSPNAGIITTQAATSNMVRGTNSATGTSATTIIAAQGSSIKTYLTNVQCFRTDSGSTMIYVTLSDSVSTVVPIPPSGGSSIVFTTPLVTASNTALTFTASAATTTVYCNAQGYTGS